MLDEAILKAEQKIAELVMALREWHPTTPSELLLALMNAHAAVIILACALDVPRPD
jgi:hypothetical protein